MTIEDSPEFEQLLQNYLKLREAGRPVNVQEFCNDNHEMIQALNSFLESEAHFKQAIEPSHKQSINSFNSKETLAPTGNPRNIYPLTLDNFGKYILRKVLGEGAMGTVYEAFDPELNRTVALKVPLDKFSTLPEHKSRFFREARSAAALDHHGICKVFDYGEFNGKPFIAMEFIQGQPLSKFIGTEELNNIYNAVEMIRNIAMPMESAHQAGIIHRDLKPGNIIVDLDFKPHITDFGLARKVEQSDASRLTHTGAILGTPAYMAPEQIKGDAELMSKSVDIYALGVILFEVITGQLPFEGQVTSILAQVLSSSPPKPSELNPDIDEELEQLCLSMLAKESKFRPASMQLVVDKLNLWLLENTSEGKKQKARKLAVHKKLSDVKAKINQWIQDGQYSLAISNLKKIQELKDESAIDYIKWADNTLNAVNDLSEFWKNELPLKQLVADELSNQKKYEELINLLEPIPLKLRTPQISKMLNECKFALTELNELEARITRQTKLHKYQGLHLLITRFLELQPGNANLSYLMEVLNTYHGVPENKRVYLHDAHGKLLPYKPFWSIRNLSVLAGIGLFLLISFFVFHNFQRRTQDEPLQHISLSNTTNPLKDLEANPVEVVEKNEKVIIQQPSLPQTENMNVIVSDNPENKIVSTATETNNESMNVKIQNSQSYNDQDGKFAGEQRFFTQYNLPFRWCPPGKFKMGKTPDDINNTNKNESTVDVELTDGFWIAETETTQKIWLAVMGTPRWKKEGTPFYYRTGDSFPAFCMTWIEAKDFCNELNKAENTSLKDHWIYCLPTEAQWEYACRAGTDTKYFFGTDINLLGDYAWYSENTHKVNKPFAQMVGLKKQNPWGLYDIYGNIKEMCLDHYSDILPGGINPCVINDGQRYVVRGAENRKGMQIMSSSYRNSDTPNNTYDFLGFRICISKNKFPYSISTENISNSTPSSVNNYSPINPINNFPQIDLNDRTGWESGVNIKNGILSGNGFYTKKQFSDFELEFDFMLEAGSNSGIGVRAPLGKDPAYYGMEIQILDDVFPKHASLRNYHKNASIYGVIGKTTASPPLTLKQWHKEKITLLGNNLKVSINDEIVINADIDKLKNKASPDNKAHPGLTNSSGYIKLCGKDDSIKFRNMFIRELSTGIPLQINNTTPKNNTPNSLPKF